MVNAVVKNMKVLPKRDPDKPDAAKDQTERKSGQEFLAHHAEPIAQTQFAESHRANHQRGGLRTGIAAAGNDERQEHRKNGGLFDLAVVALHCGGGQHFAEE